MKNIKDETIIDLMNIDGNIYKSIKIGDQTWMAENLKVSHYRNGEQIYHCRNGISWKELTDGAYCYYDDDIEIALEYGFLYNWYAVNDQRNLAPIGWHVPTYEEWKTLINYIEKNNVNLRAGGILKDASDKYWKYPNLQASNSSKFSALPGGFRDTNDIFGHLKECGNWWTSTEYNFYNSIAKTMFHKYPYVGEGSSNKADGFSVRCVKDK
jgi:uncharacterized protein (TIGR02145 family)